MNLNDLAPKLDSKKLSEAYSSQFGKKVNASSVSREAAIRMLRETRERIAEIKSSRSGHYRETNPTYLKLMFMEQALSARVAESQPESKVKVMNSKAKYMNAVKTVAVGGKLTESQLAALGVSKNLLSVLESRESAIKFMSKMVEARKCKSKGKKKMYEGTEVDQAQVVLAAQDMVDQVQKMIENMTDLKVKELPALVDGIKGEQGVDAAGQFQSAVDSALQGLIDALGGAKTELESAVGVITGEEMSVPGAELPMEPEMDMDAEMPAEPAPEMEPEMPEEEPGDELSNLGRERI
jgi:hypothetical protein